jgi:beta-xylosidase
MINLQELVIYLPEVLLEFLENDEAQAELMEELFEHIKAIPSVDIQIMSNSIDLENEDICIKLKELSEAVSLKNKRMLSLNNSLESNPISSMFQEFNN